MRDFGRIVAQIPARGGSKRVPSKNLRFLNGKPMISYAIECALQSKAIECIYVNTDSDVIANLATLCGVHVHRRPAALGSDTATGDDFTADFLQNISCDTLVMVNPVCPLVTSDDLRNALNAFAESDCDTLITCAETQMQTFCEGKAVNIDSDGPLAPSQENPVVQVLNWAVTIWDTRTYIQSYKEQKSGYLGTKRLLFPIKPSHGHKISNEEDFQEAELLLRARRTAREETSAPRYWTEADGLNEKRGEHLL